MYCRHQAAVIGQIDCDRYMLKRQPVGINPLNMWFLVVTNDLAG